MCERRSELPDRVWAVYGACLRRGDTGMAAAVILDYFANQIIALPQTTTSSNT